MPATRPRQPARQRARQDPAGAGRRAQPRRLDHRGPVHVAVLADGHVAGRDADPQRQAVLAAALRRLDRLLHRDRAPERLGRTVEDHHQPVAEALDLTPAVLLQRAAQQLQVRTLDRSEPLIA